MAIEKFKRVTVNGKEFQVGLVSAAVGNWIVLQMGGGKAADFDTYNRISDYLFSKCSVFKNEIPMKIYDGGKWLVPELELDSDLDTLNKLFMAAMDFNFTPFFEKRKQEAELEGTTQAMIPASGPTT